MTQAHGSYYLPAPSFWPLVGSIGLFTLLLGFATLLNGGALGSKLMILGGIIVAVMLFGWFGTVIVESEKGLYNDQVDDSFRWGMMWFIFSEVMFFGAFFGALFYARLYSVPWIGGEATGAEVNKMLWPSFSAAWPLLKLPDASFFTEAKDKMHAWGLPAINTMILLSSGATVTYAHWSLKHNNRIHLILGLLATVALGFLFVYLQTLEYGHAYHELNLKLSSGIYGATFYLLTGFHGLHVTIGAIMLTVVLLRCIRGHFTDERHFAFEAAAWYWHFVDVVWLGLFVFVYWL